MSLLPCSGDSVFGELEMAGEFLIYAVGKGETLGAAAAVREALVKFFPDSSWRSKTQGECGLDQGEVDFELKGNPVSIVWVRVHSTDPTLRLAALAREMGWCVANLSSGELVESELSFSEQDFKSLDKLLKRERLLVEKAQKKPKGVRLPRVRWRKPASEIAQHRSGGKGIPLAVLILGEATQDLFDDYLQFMQKRKLRSGMVHPMHGHEEILTPDGRRLAVLYLLRPQSPEQDDKYVVEYFQSTGRIFGRLKDAIISVSDGLKYRLADCTWIQRAPRRRSD